MKKLFYLASAVLVSGLVACNGTSKDDKAQPRFEEFYSQADADSLMRVMGLSDAARLYGEFERYVTEYDTTLTAKEAKMMFVEGMQYGFAADSSNMFLSGLNYGLETKYRRLKGMGATMGFNPDEAVYLSAFRECLFKDSLNMETVQTLQLELQRQQQKLDMLKARYDSLLVETSEESLAFIEEGNAILEKLKGQGYSIDGSGIAYKVIEPGEGEKVGKEDRALLNYTIKKTDGRVVRNAPGNYPVLVSMLTPKGLSYGVQKLAKGGKAEIYVPGRLAYGVNNRGTGFGPNEMVVFEVEVVDVVK